jgi:hypothetical protein
MSWFVKAAAQGVPQAARAVQDGGIPGRVVREDIACFTNAGSAPTRHAAAHEFAMNVNETFIGFQLQTLNTILHEHDSAAPLQSLRDSTWVNFMIDYGLSDDELELAKEIYGYSQRTCTLCGSSSAPLRKCSLCMELGYRIGTDCQHAHWNKTPAAESHKVLCPRIYVRGSKQAEDAPGVIVTSSSSSETTLCISMSMRLKRDGIH